MDRQGQDVLLRRAAQEPGAQDRSAREIQRKRGLPRQRLRYPAKFLERVDLDPPRPPAYGFEPPAVDPTLMFPGQKRRG